MECILLHNIFLSATVFSFYIFTFLMFRKLNKPQLTKNKQQNVIGIRAFDSRLYLDISRSFNCPKCSPVVCLICYYLQSFVSCFCIARIHFKSSHTRQFWTEIMPDLKYLSCVLYILINYTFSRLLQRTANICCSLQPTIVFFFNILSIVLITKSLFLH